MASSLFFCFSLLLLHKPLFSLANVHKINLLKSQLLPKLSLFEDSSPIRFFEVTKPIDLPRTRPCSRLVLSHDFGFTYGQPPVFADYSPPSNCPSNDFSKIVLEWKATCKGRQFDRIFGVWLGGVELLRSCTAEPTASGIVWSVEKDITRYHSLLMTNQTLAVYLGNIVDSTYTGVYHVNVTIHFYPAEEKTDVHGSNFENLGSGHGSWADLILPISRNLPLNDGLWFEIKDSMDTQIKEFKIPRNTYRAVLEVYVSFHENDEFWYTNLPNDYIAENDLSDTPGNGPFREVVVSLDGKVVGAVWPFTVIFTGGFNPLLWRPISGIGSFNLPSYEIEITPFLGEILDGKIHTFGFNVTNALNVWFVDANLHLWLDKHSPRTKGKLLKHITFPLDVSQVLDFKGLDGTFLTTASRRVLSVGLVKSSFGNILTHSIQDFYYSNSIVMQNDGDTQIVNQSIFSNDTVHVKIPFSGVYSIKLEKEFPLFLYTGYFDRGNGDYVFGTDFTLGFEQKKSSKVAGSESSERHLKNLQNGEGNMVIENDSIVGATGTTQQVYSYKDREACYLRNISSLNYDIVYDKVRKTCSKLEQLSLDFGPSNLVYSEPKSFSSI
ncbi:Peptide-N4-(N-acetyl-beta-glucosaminyl)asparagine amidase A [Parasponia andersonii]|uniref:Peptide-N4-(N-acetyl-beta-glucosaminyl)asparagine amidase A n=1 Tax=Parasponia andersonii TaxID=3476 RepID=A0A2P5A607_PARAD|nr:Peptide-N4-(N-acetyl-beta-glucosaminyl)asparagine amidase A [Parasponia andersonii]